MRKRNMATFAFTVLISGSTVFAQSGQPTMNYAWRAPASPPVGKAIVASQTGIVVEAPPAPNRLRSTQPVSLPIRVAFRQDAPAPELQDAQRSVSDQSVLQGKVKMAQPVTRPTTQPAAQSVAEPALDSGIKSNFQDSSRPIPAAPRSTSAPATAQPALSVPDTAQPTDPNYCCQDCRPNLCNLGCERKLFGTNRNGLEIGGWTQLGYHNRNTRIFNDRKSEANLHQQWLYFDKQAGVTGNWGYRADVLYGIDAQNTQAFGNSPTGAPTGWDNSWDNGAYGWAMPQLYLQYNNQAWDVKVGKFFSPFGYEVVAAPQNFFYSHSYTMNFTEPFTMTGVLGERRASDTFSTIHGVTVGWDSGFERNAGGFNAITGFRYNPNDSVNLAMTSSIGDTGYRDSGIMNSAVAQLKLTETVDYVFQADVLNLQDNNEFGIIQYLFHEVTPCLKLGSRLEWWKSDQLFADTKSTYEFTMGANYRANANITLRPELRFDWGAAAVDPGTPIVGFDAVITY